MDALRLMDEPTGGWHDSLTQTFHTSSPPTYKLPQPTLASLLQVPPPLPAMTSRRPARRTPIVGGDDQHDPLPSTSRGGTRSTPRSSTTEPPTSSRATAATNGEPKGHARRVSTASEASSVASLATKKVTAATRKAATAAAALASREETESNVSSRFEDEGDESEEEGDYDEFLNEDDNYDGFARLVDDVSEDQSTVAGSVYGDGPPTTSGTSSAHATSAHDFEFLGPHGTALVVIGVPLVVHLLHVLCNPTPSDSESGGNCPSPDFYERPVGFLLDQIRHTTFFSFRALLVVTGWLLFQALLYGFLPATYRKGTPIPALNNRRLTYTINAFSCWVTTHIGLFALYSSKGLAPFLWVADNHLQLAFATSLIALTLSGLLFLFSHRVPESEADRPILAEGGDTGYHLYDFWMGRELNPRLFGWFDLKYFCELRPGMIGWSALNICYACKQYDTYGHVSGAMWLVLLFQGLYVLDGVWNEAAILTTMDITTDGFGMMLAFGDLVWVPFTFTLQALYLTTSPGPLTHFGLLAITAIELFGMYIMRSANSEKDAFRTLPPAHPRIAHLDYIDTQRGTRLLVRGWWGVARKINYLGDWLMGISWCLTTGFASPLPYFYALYFFILLVHRAMRDDKACRIKYGDRDWERYCRRVKWVFVPGVY
ncbi:ergosterol biosynthesis ERG4/ERG24 family-domain-containing protein [Fimicolochytrium jonesii]|uniref:ergosterol biosynthesis ERG4/ERG24 family-domain-containing protein n=1 Tax=Fimicolochytrium jonesii TaxID=1396493 RepID=UPI0022FEC3EF|nr:ergosterol biosynthesis ERG4/ERG24 family-domain-containing protein [Fimicolochytrium jonesii]KAI8816949.1 ergosterol biosynthesis ERG4/ERG24 family-domain-containing protein [Fimicolochytrium jonesii]